MLSDPGLVKIDPGLSRRAHLPGQATRRRNLWGGSAPMGNGKIYKISSSVADKQSQL